MVMTKKLWVAFLLVVLSLNLSGCGRDLSGNSYQSSSTLNIVLPGIVLAKRDIKITENERLGDNTTGAVAGALAGGALASSGNNSGAMIIGGALVGGVTGAVAQSALSTAKGVEYIVKVDTSTLTGTYYEGSRAMRNALAAVRASGIITIVQAQEGKAKNPVIDEGQDVLVILSDNRSRIIPAPTPNKSR